MQCNRCFLCEGTFHRVWIRDISYVGNHRFRVTHSAVAFAQRAVTIISMDQGHSAHGHSGMHLYQGRYSGAGHNARPQFEVKGNSVFQTRFHSGEHSPMPMYRIMGSKVYATKFNAGADTHKPVFTIRGDKLRTTMHTGSGHQGLAAYRIGK